MHGRFKIEALENNPKLKRRGVTEALPRTKRKHKNTAKQISQETRSEEQREESWI